MSDDQFTWADFLRVIIVTSVVGNFILMMVAVGILWWHKRFARTMLDVIQRVVSLSSRTTQDATRTTEQAAHQANQRAAEVAEKIEIIRGASQEAARNLEEKLTGTLSTTTAELKREIREAVKTVAATGAIGGPGNV